MLFGTVKDGKLFSKKMIFSSMEENDFHFENVGWALLERPDGHGGHINGGNPGLPIPI